MAKRHTDDKEPKAWHGSPSVWASLMLAYRKGGVEAAAVIAKRHNIKKARIRWLAWYYGITRAPKGIQLGLFDPKED